MCLLLLMTPGFEVHHAAGVGLGELHHVLLDELPDAVTAAVIFTELDCDPGELRDKPAQTIVQGRIGGDPT